LPVFCFSFFFFNCVANVFRFRSPNKAPKTKIGETLKIRKISVS